MRAGQSAANRAGGESDELRAITEAQLSIEAIEIRIYGLARETERVRNLDRRATVCGQPKDFTPPLSREMSASSSV